MICEGCGCSESRPCVEELDDGSEAPCSWVRPGLCSACAPEAVPQLDLGVAAPTSRFPSFVPRQVA